ncbi:hypothetical protein BH23VER1_BH23VER1_28580 [soil metagenome]
MSFANPAGLFALLGLPLILAIHFLQRRARVLPVSTLFLLEQMERQSAAGNRFERLRPSVPLWLQLLAVLVLAWILAKPQFVRQESVARIAVVADSSASMAVFRDHALDQLAIHLDRLASSAATTEYLAFESQGGEGRIYNGTDRSALRAALESRWIPRLGQHDPSDALRIARNLVGTEGVVIYLTDSLPPDPPGANALVLAAGQPTDNAGFAGLTVDPDGTWHALARNYGTTVANRTWWIEVAGQQTAPRQLTLAPDETAELSGPIPDGATRITLRMAPDAFSLDDSLPIVRPEPKPLAVYFDGPIAPNIERLFSTLDDIVLIGGEAGADVAIAGYDPLAPRTVAESIPAAIVHIDHGRKTTSFVTGTVVAADSPLVADLNWQPLLPRATPAIPTEPTDTVLVWLGDRPLIFLRPLGGGRQQLTLNFDPSASNADRVPAFVVLVHRFLESVRTRKIAPFTTNFETGQKLAFAHRTGPDAPPLTLTLSGDSPPRDFPLAEAASITAPPLPAFFSIHQGDTRLLTAAAHFADTREADLAGAASDDSALDGLAATLTQRTARSDPWWPLPFLLILAALAISWLFATPPRPAPAPAHPST